MASLKAESVDDYIGRQPPASQTKLRQVRAAIRRALPGAEEAISYQIPTYRLHGTYVIYFAGWREHYSLYPVTARAQQVFKKELERYQVSKGTIRFPLDGSVPVRLIQRIAKFLAGEAAARTAGKRAKQRTARDGRRRTSGSS